MSGELTFEEVARYLATHELTPHEYEVVNTLLALQTKRVAEQAPDLRVVLHPVPPPAKQGYMYAYRLPIIKVRVTYQKKGGVDEKWTLVKVGRAEPDNIRDRLCSERVNLRGAHQLMTPVPELATPETAPMSDEDFHQFVHDNWAHYSDMAFLFTGNTGREKEYRSWPTGLGVEVGTGCLSPIPEKLSKDWYYDNNKIMATGLRAWILGMPMNIIGGAKYGDVTRDSMGESEWVIVPNAVFQHVRDAQIRTEAEYQRILADVHRVLNVLRIDHVDLTIEGRPDQQTLSFCGSTMIGWPGRPKITRRRKAKSK